MKKFNSFLESKSISTEQFKEKSAEEIAGLYNEYNEKNAEVLAGLVAKGQEDNVEAIKSLKEEMAENTKLQMKSLNETIKQYGLQIKKLSEQEKTDGVGVVDSVQKGLEANRDSLLKIKGDRSATLNFKAAGTMLISANVSGGNVPVEQRLPGMDAIASRRIRLLDVVTRGTAESNVISWVSQANKDGAAGGTAEGALKNQIDFDLIVVSESVKKRTAFIKVSEEMVNDISYMTAEINNELMRELLKDVEQQVYDGDNVGTNLNGIKTVATAFAAGDFAGTVDNANDADVLTVAMNQIEVAEQDDPTYAFVHPNTITSLKLIKRSTTDRDYIDRLAMVAGQMTLDGMPIIKSTLIAKGEYLIGNFAAATVYDKGEIGIEVGRDSDDFTKNLVTVLAEWRGLCLVKTNRRPAFVTGVFATDKAALETP
jgi:HK97 family phage major capsid protein